MFIDILLKHCPKFVNIQYNIHEKTDIIFQSLRKTISAILWGRLSIGPYTAAVQATHNKQVTLAP